MRTLLAHLQPIGAVARREVGSFFNSLIAYVVLAVFLAVNGLFFWVFPGNVLESGLAQLDALFFFTPWLFLFLVPALTMRAISEELRQGTYELLLSKPLLRTHLLLGKFAATVALVVVSLLPTVLYYATVYQLGAPTGNLDQGATWGAYIGLVLIGMTFAAVGLWSSTLSQNQIVAFLVGAFVCFFLYQGFAYLALIPSLLEHSAWLSSLGLLAHYESISRGVVDSRDLLYFSSLTVFFLAAAGRSLHSRHA